MPEAQPATNPQAWWLAAARGAEFAELYRRRRRRRKSGVAYPMWGPVGDRWVLAPVEGRAGLVGDFYRYPGSSQALSRFETGRIGLDPITIPGLQITKEPDGRIKVVRSS